MPTCAHPDVLLDKGRLRVERQAVEVDGEGARITEPKAGGRSSCHTPPWTRCASMPPGLPGASLFTRPDGSELRADHVHYGAFPAPSWLRPGPERTAGTSVAKTDDFGPHLRAEGEGFEPSRSLHP